jgi:hypothetical protein
MQFKCVKEEGSVTDVKNFSTAVPFIDIYWKPISY